MDLRSEMQIKGYTPELLAIKVGVCTETIRRYMRGSRIPDIKTAARIGEALEISSDELLKIFSEASA